MVCRESCRQLVGLYSVKCNDHISSTSSRKVPDSFFIEFIATSVSTESIRQCVTDRMNADKTQNNITDN